MHFRAERLGQASGMSDIAFRGPGVRVTMAGTLNSGVGAPRPAWAHKLAAEYFKKLPVNIGISSSPGLYACCSSSNSGTMARSRSLRLALQR